MADCGTLPMSTRMCSDPTQPNDARPILRSPSCSPPAPLLARLCAKRRGHWVARLTPPDNAPIARGIAHERPYGRGAGEWHRLACADNQDEMTFRSHNLWGQSSSYKSVTTNEGLQCFPSCLPCFVPACLPHSSPVHHSALVWWLGQQATPWYNE